MRVASPSAVFCISIVTLVSCTRATGRSFVLTEKDAEIVCVAAVGDTITVKLRVVPANGYLWRATEVGAGISQTSPTKFEATPESGAPGNVEFQTFKFTVTKPGVQRLQVAYSRRTDVVKRYTFNIDVR